MSFKRKIRQIKENIKQTKRKIMQITSFLILIPIFSFTFFSLDYFTVDDTLLNTLTTASSIIVALIIGFLFNTHFQLKQIKLKKLARFGELQDELGLYQKAFSALADQLSCKYDIFQFPRGLLELQQDKELQRKDEYVPIIWQRLIHEASILSSIAPDFEIRHLTLTQKKLDEMVSQVDQALGLLGSYKHYKYILKMFNLLDTQDFDKINIADDSRGMKYRVKGILNDNEDYHTLGFWEIKLEKWHDILQRLQTNGRFVYSYVSSNIKTLSLDLLFVAVFGVIIPIFLQSINDIPNTLEKYLENLSMIGFITYFSLSLFRVYKRITSKKLTFD